MMAAHTARLIPFDVRPAWAFSVLLYEPVIPSLFLLLVGVSLSRSSAAALARGETPRAWFARQARRAAGLWAISVVFFVAEYGIRLPDALLTGGVLALIAYSILLIAALLLLPARARAAGIAAALAAGGLLFLRIDATGRSMYPFASGSAPFLPLMLFALAGAWVGGGSGISGGGPRVLRFALAIAGAALAAGLIARHGASALFTKPFGRGDAGRDLAAALFPAGAPLHAGFYNLRPVLALECLGLHLAALGFLAIALRKVPERIARIVFALGRHALGAYVLHLTLLAALVVACGLHPLKAPWQWRLALATVLLASWGWCLFRESQKQRKSSG